MLAIEEDFGDQPTNASNKRSNRATILGSIGANERHIKPIDDNLPNKKHEH
jgi:hypothetical protein